jgi:hypothetical protein
MNDVTKDNVEMSSDALEALNALKEDDDMSVDDLIFGSSDEIPEIADNNIETLEDLNDVFTDTNEIISRESIKNIFSDESMMKWIHMLPKDFQKSIRCEQDESGNITDLSLDILYYIRNNDYKKVVSILKNNQENMNAFGRARRIRLLSLMASHVLKDEDDSDGKSSFQEVGILFIEDLKHLAEMSLAPRLIHSMLNEENLSYINKAVSELSNESALNFGGKK